MQNQTELADTTLRNSWVGGFSPQAELWNGRFAMIGFVSALIVEVYSNEGVLHFWGLINMLFATVFGPYQTPYF